MFDVYQVNKHSTIVGTNTTDIGTYIVLTLITATPKCLVDDNYVVQLQMLIYWHF